MLHDVKKNMTFTVNCDLGLLLQFLCFTLPFLMNAIHFWCVFSNVMVSAHAENQTCADATGRMCPPNAPSTPAVYLFVHATLMSCLCWHDNLHLHSKRLFKSSRQSQVGKVKSVK